MPQVFEQSLFLFLSKLCVHLVVRKSIVLTAIPHCVGGFYSVSGAATGLPFTLLGLNTNVFYKSNDLVDEDDDDPLGQLSWLESQLRDCRESDTRALIFAHVPPGKFERYYQPYDGEEGGYGFPWFRADLNDQFLKIIDDYSDVIAGQFYGHHHTDMVKVTGDSSWAALAPALAPMRSTLAPETGATNPALRLVLFDKDTGEVGQISLLRWNLGNPFFL